MTEIAVSLLDTLSKWDYEAMKQIVLYYIGQLVLYGGGSVAIAYGAFVFFGKNWIEHKFSERLKKFEHELSKQLADHQAQIDSKLNRLQKLHNIEFAMLPKLWRDIARAYNKLEEIYYRALQLNPIENCRDVSLERLNEFMTQAAFSEEEKTRVKNVEYSCRFHAYQKLKLEKAHRDAKTPLLSFYENYTSNKILIGDKLRLSIEGLIETMSLVYAWLGEGGKTDLPSKSYNKEYETRYVAMRDAFKNIDRDFRILLYPSENMD